MLSIMIRNMPMDFSQIIQCVNFPVQDDFRTSAASEKSRIGSCINYERSNNDDYTRIMEYQTNIYELTRNNVASRIPLLLRS